MALASSLLSARARSKSSSTGRMAVIAFSPPANMRSAFSFSVRLRKFSNSACLYRACFLSSSISALAASRGSCCSVSAVSAFSAVSCCCSSFGSWFSDASTSLVSFTSTSTFSVFSLSTVFISTFFIQSFCFLLRAYAIIMPVYLRK